MIKEIQHILAAFFCTFVFFFISEINGIRSSSRGLETTSCIFIRDEVDGKPISSRELKILQKGENYLSTVGSLHTNELEVLMKVCEVLPECYVLNEKKKPVLDKKLLFPYFIDSRFHSENLLGKFCSVAKHLQDRPAIHRMLKAHHEGPLSKANWKVSALLPGGIWELPVKELSAFVRQVNSGIITSEQKSRKYLANDKFRRNFCVSFSFLLVSCLLSVLFIVYCRL